MIESVRSIELPGPGTGLSTMEGGAGFSGFRLGAGADGALLVLLGAMTMGTGAPAPSRLHEVTVRLEDGSERVFRDARAHEWRAGDRVRVVAGSLRRQPG